MPHRLMLFLFLSLASVSLSFAASTVKPPEHPSTDWPVRDEAEVRKLPKREQPTELKQTLMSLTEGAGTIEERVARLKQKALVDLVFVKGGSFEMGDRRPYFAKQDNHPVHPVQLTGFYISRYKTTYAEFDTYTDATKTDRTIDGRYWVSEPKRRHPLLPAGAYWQRARDYCQWLGKLTGLPFDLPTEAQWEYAARSRGQKFVFPTDNGHLEHGKNIPGSALHMKLISPLPSGVSSFPPYPVGMFPPNPLGLYDMAHNGMEWMLDWYAEDYYANSPKVDPKGPPTGEKKVARSWPTSDDTVMLGDISASRRAHHPMLLTTDLSAPGNKLVPGPAVAHSLRCVVHTDKPLPKQPASPKQAK
jgi:formylglycine-generating enzyme required for sulfatase activity